MDSLLEQEVYPHNGRKKGTLATSTPEPTTEPKAETSTPEPEPTSEPEKVKPEPEDKSPSAEEIANYATLGVLVGIFFITTIVFGLLWWRVRKNLKQVQAANQLPQKPGLTV
eukprot:gene7652-13473_t